MKKLTLLLITLCILITTVYAYNLTTIVNGNKLTAIVNSGENVSLEYDDVDGYTFDGWSTTGVTLTNPTSKNTSFTMPANDVTIEPNMSLSHVHSYSEATCTVPPTCSCGATNGSALGHSWNNATCTVAKTCSVCSATEGNALGHSWVNATCTTAKTCSVCSVTEGNALGHSYTGNRTCNVNGSTDTVQCTRCTSTESQECTHTYTITVTQGDNGTISPTSATVKAGGSATFTVTANSGYEISDILINEVSIGAKTSHTISNITSNQTITAIFEVNKTNIPVGAYVTYRPSSTSYKVYATDAGEGSFYEWTEKGRFLK